MGADLQGALADGGKALAEGEWELARTLFEGSLAEEESPEAHTGLGEALWWLGDLAGAIEHRERAYILFKQRQELEEAFLNALLVILDYQGHVGNFAASAGWLARAQRLIDDSGLEALQGWLWLAEAGEDIDPLEGEVLARQALEMARSTNDSDLELCALSRLGSHLVNQGRVSEGINLLDEAMAGSLGGEGESRGTVVLTSCNMMVSCVGVADFDRATHWIHAADRFTQRFGCPFLYAECRTIYGSILFATGDWPGAERELRTAITSAKGSVPVFHQQALAAFAGLRLAQGDVAGARQLLSGVEDHPWAIPVAARMHLIAGRPAAAEALLQQRLREVGANRLEMGLLRELLGEAEITLKRGDEAREGARELIKLGEELDCAVLSVRGERLLGRACHADGQEDAARRHLETAITGFRSLGMVYEAALTRLLLGTLLSESEPEVAEAELLASAETLERLGARLDADRAAGELRGLGVATGRRTGARNQGPLTNREEQVLGLLGEGLSNPEIADRLYISRKTVEHHVARVLAKLGVRNRAEAAAESVRMLGTESAQK